MVIWDRLNTHRSIKVLHLKTRHPRLHLEYFPAYAPELNPVEYVWSYLKNNPMANRPAFDITELAQSTYVSGRRLQAAPALLKSFLDHAHLSLRIK